MRKVSYYLFALIALLTVATSCKKNRPDPIDDTPKTEIPDPFVGKWLIGNENPAHFSDYDGSREDDLVITIAYNFKKDGTAEQFIYIYEEDEARQTLTLRKGTVSYDEATATLKFNPKQGQYRIFKNGEKSEGNISSSGLYPAYAPTYRNCSTQEEDGVKYLLGINQYDETQAFAKVNW